LLRSNVSQGLHTLVSELSDIGLMERILLRDTGALRSLYERHGRVAFALACRVIGDASGAEEVVQDAFQTVWTNAHALSTTPDANVRGWLMTIVHRRAIDFRRHEYARPPRNVPIDTMDHVLGTPDVWNDVSATLLGQQVRAAMASLPDQQRRAIELAYFDGLSHGEIASLEGAPLGTVKGRLRLGLRKLSGLLEGADDHYGSMREEQV
jgi:RNA polymerase sigma-70 factor (ECF subfamily)